MKYYFEKTIDYSFDKAIEKVTEALKKEGFGILSEINIHEKLKEKLDVDFRKYRILGACNPSKAYEALQADYNIGTMLPCNVVVQEVEAKKTKVVAVDPVASMQAVENAEIKGIAQEISTKLQKVIQLL